MNKWSKENEIYLKETYNTLPTKLIAKKLNKTPLAIWKKAHKIGLVLSPEIEKLNRSLSRKGILFKNGRRKSSKGYVMILKKDHPRADKCGYVFEHILVAEQKIGRLISREESVHHINGIKNDNRPENLMIMKNGEHTRLHNLRRKKNNE